jgi:hypothetical protein
MIACTRFGRPGDSVIALSWCQHEGVGVSGGWNLLVLGGYSVLRPLPMAGGHVEVVRRSPAGSVAASVVPSSTA